MKSKDKIKILRSERAYIHQRTMNIVTVVCAFLTILTMFVVGAVFLGYLNANNSSPNFNGSIFPLAVTALFGFFAIWSSMKSATHVEDSIYYEDDDIIKKEVEALKEARVTGEFVNICCIISIGALLFGVLLTLFDTSGQQMGTSSGLKVGMAIVTILTSFFVLTRLHAIFRIKGHTLIKRKCETEL